MLRSGSRIRIEK